jgi:hypothetical protein
MNLFRQKTSWGSNLNLELGYFGLLVPSNPYILSEIVILPVVFRIGSRLEKRNWKLIKPTRRSKLESLDNLPTYITWNAMCSFGAHVH